MNQVAELENTVNRAELEARVKAMYREVALAPEGAFHFEMGRALAERLGYPAELLNDVPAAAIHSFAGVGYHFGLAGLRPGENVVDMGSGSGMDVFFAARQVGPAGEVIGIDMTPEQLAKSQLVAEKNQRTNTIFLNGYIEELPIISGCLDVVISNGVINLSSDKERVFREAARVLKPGGRLAISDIVSESTLPESIKCNASLWAACIGGAMQEEAYLELISAAGFRIEAVKDNPQYQFLSKSAVGTGQRYGVKSISVLAVKV